MYFLETSKFAVYKTSVQKFIVLHKPTMKFQKKKYFKTPIPFAIAETV